MRALRFAIALLVGFILYQVAVVLLGGYLSAVPIPGAYFEAFGKESSGIGLALVGLALHVAPTVLLVAGGVVLFELLWPSHRVHVVLPYLLGMLSCALLWEVYFGPACLPQQAIQRDCGIASLERILAVPWWALPVVAAPWVGLALASWLLKRRARSGAHGVA